MLKYQYDQYFRAVRFGSRFLGPGHQNVWWTFMFVPLHNWSLQPVKLKHPNMPILHVNTLFLQEI